MHTSCMEIRNLEVCYGKTPVLRDVSVQVEEGEILGVVGESGSGKSTLLKAAMGLLGNAGVITKGDIFYKGSSLLDADAEAVRALRGPEIGIVFQNTGASLCPVRTVESQLMEAVTAHEAMRKDEIRKRALDIFSKMRIADGQRILKSYPFELSGGLNQRVGIMMAMILRPTLLFADEPTSALDVTVQAEVIREMLRMREAYGTAIVIVTHNIGIVERMADAVAVMHEGKIAEYGKKEDVLRNPQSAYTGKLLDAVVRIKRRR